MRALFSSLFGILALTLTAQTNKPYTTAAESDPEAREILDAIRQKYDAYRTLTADFRLDLAFPDQPVETQRGTIRRKGDLVRFKLGDQEGIINQEAAYYILHGSREVQISDLPDPEETTGMLTPQNLFNFYEGDGYVLALQGEEYVKGRQLTVIEMKPLDRDNSDFTKLRLLVDERAQEVYSIRAFSRDGSSYTFYLDKTDGNAALAGSTFTFDEADFPGYHVEDLRF
jgi:outer membrane lipoprotein-sorting protein